MKTFIKKAVKRIKIHEKLKLQYNISHNNIRLWCIFNIEIKLFKAFFNHEDSFWDYFSFAFVIMVKAS